VFDFVLSLFLNLKKLTPQGASFKFDKWEEGYGFDSCNKLVTSTSTINQ
jgi:hypothetical protein